MKREYHWEVPVDGTIHRVTCTPTGNRYIIWVDDEESTVVYRLSSRKMRDGLEKKLDICGKECLLVVWDERPNLVVDGQMLGSGKNFQQEKEKRIKGILLLYQLFFVLAAVLLAVVIVFFCFGWIDKSERAGYVRYMIASIWVMIGSMLGHRRWKSLS